MDKKLLATHIQNYLKAMKASPDKVEEDAHERAEIIAHYQSWTDNRLRVMTHEDMYAYLSPLWALQMWGNKHLRIDKLVVDNGLDDLRAGLAELLWGTTPFAGRWDHFRRNTKGFGPAMMSELLCKTHPTQYALGNSKAFVGLHYLGVENLPRRSYQMTGVAYERVCAICKEIAVELKAAGAPDHSLLAVDYLIWEELQVEEPVSSSETQPDAAKSGKKKTGAVVPIDEVSPFVHNDIRDMLQEIGVWLGFSADTEKKVADGAVVDTVWEATVGNMGRIIYVFEVQTKGSIDSLLVNLTKAMNNPAVQGVVAVSDTVQIDKIRKHSKGMASLENLKYWDYEDVARVREALASINESINALGLVAEGF
jgi:hypothetical protein